MTDQNPYSTPSAEIIAEARLAEWHWMLTATGFMVMCVAAVSTWTAKAVPRPPSPCGPMPRLFTAIESIFSSFSPSGSSQAEPSGRVAATLARCMQGSEVPPTPTPTMVGGQTRPPTSITRSITKALMPSLPSAGISIFRNEPFSDPAPDRVFQRNTVDAHVAADRDVVDRDPGILAEQVPGALGHRDVVDHGF